MRRLILLLALALASAAAPSSFDDNSVNYDFFGADFRRFDEAYLQYRAVYLGCPKPAGPTVCDFSLGHHDYHLFHLSRERAKALFGLR